MCGNMCGCPVARYARLSGCPEICPTARNYARNVRLPRHRHYGHAWTPNASFQRRRWRHPPTGTSDGAPPRPKIAPSSGAAPAASAAKQCWAAVTEKNDGMMPEICSFFYVTKACECCSKYTILFMIQKYVNDSQKCTTFSLPRY